MTLLHKKFIRGMQWNAAEKLLYNPLYFAHYAFLFKVADPVIYGLAGTLFAGIALITTVTNLGFNGSIGGFFDLLTKSKKNFLRFFLINLAPQAIFLIGGIWITWLGIITLPIISSKLNGFTFTILALALIVETIRRKGKTILQLAFKNRITALAEITYLLVYLILFWSGYFLGYSISLSLIFVPLLIASLISTLILGAKIYQVYQTLPDDQRATISLDSWKLIFITRSVNFFHGLGHLMFSSNFLVPLFAITCGLEQAGVFTLISNLCYSLTSFFHKILGEAGGAYLSQSKKESPEVKHAIFVTLLNIANNVLIAFVIFVSINYNIILKYNGLALGKEHWSLIPLFLMLALSENFFLIFEKFFITQNKPYYLLTITMSNALIFLIIYLNSFQQRPIETLLLMTGLRIATFIMVLVLTFSSMNKKPTFSLQPRYLFYSLILSLGVFLSVHYLQATSFFIK